MSTPSNALADILPRLRGAYLRDQARISEACRLASQNDDSAAEATAQLATLLRHQRPQVRVDAARLWALMLCNCTDTFIKVATTEEFLENVKSLLEGGLTYRQERILVEDIGKSINSLRLKETPSSLRRFWTSIQSRGGLNLVPGYVSPSESSPNTPISPTFSYTTSSSSSGGGSFYRYPPVLSTSQERRRNSSSLPLDEPSIMQVGSSAISEGQRLGGSPVPQLPMIVKWSGSTTSGYSPQEEWINRNVNDNRAQQDVLAAQRSPTAAPSSSSQRQTRHRGPNTRRVPVLQSPSAVPALAMSSLVPSLGTLGTSLRSLQGTRALLNLSIRDFCAQISQETNVESGRISQLHRGKESGMGYHEFLAFTVVVPRSFTLWGRLDRRPVAGGGSFLLSSPSEANDVIVFATSKRSLVPSGARIAAISSLNSPVSLRDLGKILDIVEEEAPLYQLRRENCWFFASIIEDLLISLFDGSYSRGRQGHADLAPEIRQRIRDRVREKFQS